MPTASVMFLACSLAKSFFLWYFTVSALKKILSPISLFCRPLADSSRMSRSRSVSVSCGWVFPPPPAGERVDMAVGIGLVGDDDGAGLLVVG